MQGTVHMYLDVANFERFITGENFVGHVFKFN